jgi:hypothetical protein
LREPKDVAWFIASYARDAHNRVEDAGALPALANVRAALEQALGVTFEAERGAHFFRSTLVQTLFYGLFSAWVLWARQTHVASQRFDWRTAVWHLTVPFIRTLFQQLASPSHLQPLRLVEVLDWTAATLNRINSTEFFKRFNDAEAVQFFYEPFLEAFDPELQKELGVWYTPNEVVAYMVTRIDKALRQDLGVADGLASEQVYILDPCCGTGAFLAAVLRKIDASLAERGYGALKGQMVKKAALSRVFRDHARAFRRGASASRPRAATARRNARRRARAGWGLSHQCADRLGTACQQAPALSRTRRGARQGGKGQAGSTDPRHPRQPAL